MKRIPQRMPFYAYFNFLTVNSEIYSAYIVICYTGYEHMCVCCDKNLSSFSTTKTPAYDMRCGWWASVYAVLCAVCFEHSLQNRMDDQKILLQYANQGSKILSPFMCDCS